MKSKPRTNANAGNKTKISETRAEGDEFVGRLQHLKTKTAASKALDILRKIASQVKPILKRRSWHVKILAEFIPKNDNLLGMNVNHGYKVMLRLRAHYDESVFLSEDDILGTMLHELAHIVHGPHDEKFYRLLDEMNNEMDGILASGYTGECFQSQGQRLGGSSQLSLTQTKRLAHIAAEKRKNLGQLLGNGSGQRLGGGKSMSGLPDRQVVAEAAEKRKRRDNIACETLDGQENDALMEESSDGCSSMHSGMKAEADNIIAVVPAIIPKRKSGRVSDSSTFAKKDAGTWTCEQCTLQNPAQFLQCEACGKERPAQITLAHNLDLQWMCEVCSLVNDDVRWLCEACGGVRTGGGS